LKKLLNKGNLLILALWALWFLLLWYVSITAKDLKPFDPFEILEIEPGATDKEIKKAYRTLSLKFHPDKNPDPKATQYFAEYITKAYQALTDEVSRKNYEKYGHPDGPQAMNVGVALPEWMFAKDKNVAPLMLLALVGVGILLPLAAVSWYMLSSNKFTGPNRIMQETLAFYYHSKYSVKESQALVRIPETLVCAMEFITMPTPSEQTLSLDELRKIVLRSNPDLKEKTQFWKRKASVLKAHMLLLAHLDRETDNVPANLQADMKYVLTKSLVLLEEMLKIAMLPRPPHGYGWQTPSLAIVEMLQCMSQALSIEFRKPTGKLSEASAGLLQLPHFDTDVLKKLKRRKVNTLKELQDLEEKERVEALQSCGLASSHVEEISTLLSSLPSIYVRAACEVDGEEEIMEGDVAKCKVRIMLTRPSHNAETFEVPTKGKAIRAFAPKFPAPRDESWYFFLTDQATNSLMGYTKASLQEAEAYGFAHPEAAEDWAAGAGEAKAAGTEAGKDNRPVPKALATATKFINRYSNGRQHTAGAEDSGEGGSDEEAGQEVELSFMAPPKAGKYELQLHVMSDCYVGCDKVVPVKLRVSQMTRAIAEGRDAKALAKMQQWQDSDEEEDGEEGKSRRKKGKAEPKAEGSEEEGKGEEEEEEEEEEDEDEGDDYDSDETGELETGSEDEEEEEGEEEGEDLPPLVEQEDVMNNEGKSTGKAAAGSKKNN